MISPGVDLETFHPLPEVARRDDMLLALGRSQPIKNLATHACRVAASAGAAPGAVSVRSEPELANEPGIRYVTAPTDAEVNELLSQATAFVQTSKHEGFCLTILEAMAAGCPVVCTDADGNRDFCANEENCLMPDARPAAVAADVGRVLADPALRSRLGQAGIATAGDYGWGQRIDALERFMFETAGLTAARHRGSGI